MQTPNSEIVCQETVWDDRKYLKFVLQILFANYIFSSRWPSDVVSNRQTPHQNNCQKHRWCMADLPDLFNCINVSDSVY